MFTPDRNAERPIAHLQHFKGVLHVDGYAGFERVAARENVTLAACWAHTRRKFYDVEQQTGSPVAAEALRHIATLYEVEKKARGQSPTQRIAWRRSLSRPHLVTMQSWLETQLGLVPARSTLADAMRYALGRWAGLTRFLDGVERATNPFMRARSAEKLGERRAAKDAF